MPVEMILQVGFCHEVLRADCTSERPRPCVGSLMHFQVVFFDKELAAAFEVALVLLARILIILISISYMLPSVHAEARVSIVGFPAAFDLANEGSFPRVSD